MDSYWDVGPQDLPSANTDVNTAAPATSGTDGWSWGGFGKLGMDLLGSTLPNMLGAAAGYGFNALFPGKTSLVDTRTPEQRSVSGMNVSRLQALQQNPGGFGLPGDPNDPSTPAGKKRYDIIQGSRSADAARGMFTTGGSAQRETNALNTAIGNEFNTIWNQASQQGAAGGPMRYVEKANPWAQLATGVAQPAVQGLTRAILKNFGWSG